MESMDTDSFKKLFDELNEKINNLATKDDVFLMKEKLQEMTDNVIKRMETLEGQVLEVETKAAKTDKDVKVVNGRCSRLQNNLLAQETRIKNLEKEQNDLQQYARRWNLRVYRVPEVRAQEKEDCEKKVCDIFSNLIGVKTTPQDLEAAHRTGKPGEKARPILVRFFNRKQRDAILAERRKLKNKGYVIDEDLTHANYMLSRKAVQHSCTMSVWSSNGKILAKVKSGKIVRLDIHSDVDGVLVAAMQGD